MHLEFYPGMTEHQLARIAARAQDRWNLAFLGVLHRTGRVLPTETLVLVAARARHRGDAMDACREVIEALKHEAPFWKREVSPQGTVRWVEGNSSGYLRR
jgi:molybdopterin synthase catalytic subunit